MLPRAVCISLFFIVLYLFKDSFNYFASSPDTQARGSIAGRLAGVISSLASPSSHLSNVSAFFVKGLGFNGPGEMHLRAFVLALLLCASANADFEDSFKNCHPNVSGFDVCVREGLNSIRPYFKTGIPKYDVPPFDPFFAREITARRGMPNFGFTLTLRNVTENGWSISKVTKFVSDMRNHKVVYTQSFPEKALTGNYEFKGALFSASVSSKGKFTMTLYDLIQTTTVTKLPGQKVRAQMDVENIRDMSLHLTNLLSGKEFLENMLDKIINGAWQPGFVVTRRLVNELVSTAFTEIFDNVFRNFPFEQIFKPKPPAS